MLISTEIASFRKTINDDFEIVKLLKQAGFTAYDFSMSNAQFALEFLKDDSCYDFAKKLRKFADDIGIVCNQTHAPFPTLKRDDEWNKTMLSALKRSIKVSSILGAKICVVHPGNLFSIEENTALYRELLPIAKECNIKIATENMWDWDREKNTFAPAANSNHVSFKAQMDELNKLDKDVFVALVDIGHCELTNLNTSAVKMIETLNENVQCIHLHDNDKYHDAHFLPFTSAIDYLPIIDALKKINYSGDITLECSYFAGMHLPKDLVLSFMRLYADVANWFKEQIEK